MYMQFDHTLTTLYDHIDSGDIIYKNTLLHGIQQSTDYKLHKYTKLNNKAVISELWLDYIDGLSWDELAVINQERWIAEKRIELGIKKGVKYE